MKRVLLLSLLVALLAWSGVASGQGCEAPLPTWHPGYWWSYQVQGLDFGSSGELFQITEVDRYVLGVRRVNDEHVYLSSVMFYANRAPMVDLWLASLGTRQGSIPFAFWLQGVPYPI